VSGAAGQAGTGDPAGLAVSYLAGSTAGGTGRHVAMLAGGCAARGATVHVYGPAAPVPAAPRPGGDFSEVDIAARPRPARDAAALAGLRRLVARDQPDVLHAHGLRAGALAALALAWPGTPRTALVVTVHNAPPASGPSAAVYAVLELIVARRADAVLTVSADLDGRMRRRGARLAGRALVPAPAAAAPSPAGVAELRRELAGDDPAERKIVAAAGRLAAQKGFGTLIQAAARWQGRPAVPLLLIAGEGPLGGELRRQAEAAGVGARFLCPRPDVPALLAAADVVVVPSLWEGQPLIVQETLRAGRPLVATRVGGIAELTGDDGAVLVPPRDPGALAAAVTRLLGDPAAAGRLAAAALARAALLPGEAAAVDQVLGIYQRVR
jgi:glycosyltransferase involved in cell wall biosynthesis